MCLEAHIINVFLVMKRIHVHGRELGRYIEIKSTYLSIPQNLTAASISVF